MNIWTRTLVAQLAAAIGLGLLLATYPVLPVSAHGKEVQVTIASLTSDPQRPLTRLYRATVVYAGDLELVEGAKVGVTAVREEGGSAIGPVPFTALEGNPGIYVAEVTYPRFGSWTLALRVSERGEGETTFVDRVRPPGAEASEAMLAAEQERIQKLQLFFRFGWKDVVHILVRIAHSLAGVTYFGLTGLILFVLWFKATRTRPGTWKWLRKVFLPGTLASLAIVLASGLYTAYYDAPVNPPGVFDLDAMAQLPFGYAYLAGFWAKAPLGLALLLVAWQIHRAMKSMPQAIAGASIDTISDAGTVTAVSAGKALKRLSILYTVIGLLVLADIAVVIYMHYVSHLGIFLPSQ